MAISSRRPTTAIKESLRSLRPVGSFRQTPHRRVFTQNAQLLLLARHTPRPQLPYLSQPAFSRPQPLNGPSQQLARLLSTETRQFVREQTWLAVKWTAIGWTFLILGGIAYFGIQLEIDERTNPTPSEWEFSTRQLLRAARVRMDPQTAEKAGFTDWAKIGADLRAVIELLENTEKQGKGLVQPVDGEELLIPGVGKAGYDISAKSWPWRAGYFEVIMGAGKAAEHLEGMVLDETRRIVFPREVMIGPSNPDPRPVPPYMNTAPLEENCVPAFPGPETFYMRVLTGKGFSTKQKLESALAYANWLEYKQLSESAEEMYKWAVDIAADALPISVSRNTIVDANTGIIKQNEKSQSATPNLLRASTELATHYARNGNVSSALPIFLSVLRARRDAVLAPFPQETESSSSRSDKTNFLRKLFQPPVFPPPPPSGDDALVRYSPRPSCDESELMLYIGEIVFATSPQSSEGAGWTRQAVTIAEANLERGSNTPVAETSEEKQKCKECLMAGVGNWEVMLQRLGEQALPGKEGQRKSWFGGFGSRTDELQKLALQEDFKRIAGLKDRIVREGIDEQIARGQGKNPSGVWIG